MDRLKAREDQPSPEKQRGGGRDVGVLKIGFIDMVSSDHAPWPLEKKTGAGHI